MLYREMSRILGKYLFYFTFALIIPLGVAIAYDFFLSSPQAHPPSSTIAFVWTLGINLILSVFFWTCGRKASGVLYRHESIILVALIWLITAGIGAIPFWQSKTLSSPLDAYFESMSGLTTTGATMMYPRAFDPLTKNEIPVHFENENAPISYSFYGTINPVIDPKTQLTLKSGIEAVSESLLFWRSFLQWLGGMGIVVLFIAILPALSMGGKFLLESEMPGPTKETMTPRIKETASLLWKIYVGLTAVQVVFLMIADNKLSFFKVVCIAFSTISTGGFFVQNSDLMSQFNLGTIVIIMVFMLLGSINFSLYFHCIRGKIYRLYEPEFMIYLLILACSTIILSLTFWKTPGSSFDNNSISSTYSKALMTASFQAVSAQTSTGFSSSGTVVWPASSQLILIVLMFIGGMSGSTSGGMKVARLLILFRSIFYKIESIFRPDAVRCLKIGKKEISDKTTISVLIFFAILIFLTVVGTFFLVLDGIDPQTSLSVITCMVNNSGIIFHGDSMLETCAFLPTFSKIISVIWMVLGRLEFFVLLVLLSPSFWKKR